MENNNIPEVDYASEIHEALEWAKASLVTPPAMELFRTGTGGGYAPGDVEAYIDAVYKAAGVAPSPKYRQQIDARNKAIAEAERLQKANEELERKRAEHRQRKDKPAPPPTATQKQDEPRTLIDGLNEYRPVKTTVGGSDFVHVRIRQSKQTAPLMIDWQFGPDKQLPVRTIRQARYLLDKVDTDADRKKLTDAFPDLLDD